MRKLALGSMLLAGCFACNEKGSRNEELVKERNVPVEIQIVEDSGKWNKEKSLKEIHDSFPPKSLDNLRYITSDALQNSTSPLEELRAAFDESYGKRPMMIGLSTTWCGPCKAGYPKLLKSAEENPDIGFVYAVIDNEIVRVETTSALEVILGYNGAVPAYFAIDKSGQVINRNNPYYLISDAIENAKNPSSNNDRVRIAEYMALFDSISKENNLPVDTKQVPTFTIDGKSSMVGNLYELVNRFEELEGVHFPWVKESEDYARSKTLIMYDDNVVVPQVLDLLSFRLDTSYDEGGKRFMDSVEEYRKKIPDLSSPRNTFSLGAGTQLSYKGEFEKYLMYSAEDWFEQIQGRTNVRIEAYEDVSKAQIPALVANPDTNLFLLFRYRWLESGEYDFGVYRTSKDASPLIVLKYKD